MPLIGGRWRPKRGPLHGAQIAPVRTPPCECGPHSHERYPDGTWGRCRRSSCTCLGWHRPPTCVRCGEPTGGAARCDGDCQPRVSKQSKREDGTRDG